MKELIALREAVDKIEDALNDFASIIHKSEPDWTLGGSQIWTVEDAMKDLMKAAWAYDRVAPR